MYKLGILLSIMALCGVNGNNGESYGSMCDNVKGKIIDRCIKEVRMGEGGGSCEQSEHWEGDYARYRVKGG